MNTPGSFQAGWALFFAAGIGGAYLGYRRNKDAQQLREKENEVLLQQQRESVRKLDEKLQQSKGRLAASASEEMAQGGKPS